MRDIKFRGVCQISKELVFGDLIHGVSYKSGSLYILPNKVDLAYVKHCDPLDGVRIINETISQFTGLKDANGNDIYEGDIVQTYNWGLNKATMHVDVIEWDIDENGWDFRTGWVEDRYDFKKTINVCEVIGNIYQNPELLKS